MTLFGSACTTVAFGNPTEPNGDVNSSGAPFNGVITKFRLKAVVEAPTQVTFRLVELSDIGPGAATGSAVSVATGPTVTLATTEPNEAPIQEFATHMTVKKGQHLALDSSTAKVVYAPAGGGLSLLYNPALVDGHGEAGLERIDR